MGLKDDDEDEGNVRMYIGRTVKKFFEGYGNFLGEVVSFNKSRKFFKVKYADGDREELDLSELKEILVDVETKSVKESPKSKGTVGRKRKRDQPVKYTKGAVENGPAAKCEESVYRVDVSPSKEKPSGKTPSENLQPGESTVVSEIGYAVPEVREQVVPLLSDQPHVHEVISTNGVVHVDEKVDHHADGRGKRRTVELVDPVEDNSRPTRLKKRARDASSSGPSGREGISPEQPGHSGRERMCPEQPGQQLLELNVQTSLVASRVVKEVTEDGVDACFNSSLLPLPPLCGSMEQVSQADVNHVSVESQLISQTDCNQNSASALQVVEIAASPQQQLTINGSGCWVSGNPSASPFVTPETKCSPAPKCQRQVETVAKDVYSLRAIRAISRSLPVQRQMVTYAAGEEFESTDREVVTLNEELEPDVVSLKQPLPPSSTCLGDLEHCIADVFQAYSFLRSFSHALFISPFALEEFVVALVSDVVSPLLDCVHVSLLQGLYRHLERLAKNGNNSAILCLRLSDWSLLDNITWPSYLMAYALTQGFLVGRGRSFQFGLVSKDYYKLPIDKKLAFLNFLCDKVLETDDIRTEITRRVALENDSELLDLKTCASKRPDRSRRDVISLEGEFDEEFERMTRQKRESVTQKNGMQPLDQGKSLHAGDVKQPERGEDGNLDECALCGMDGVLICCDGCPAAYHSRCVGITKQGLPPGDWFCPECRADKLDSKGVKIPRGVRGGELLFIGPDGQRFFSNCGYLLVSEPSLETDSVYRYYSPKDIPVFLKYLEDAGRRYAALQAAIHRLCQPDLDSTGATVQIVSATQMPGSITLEDTKVDPPDVPKSAGDLTVISSITLGSYPELRDVKSDVLISPEPPAVTATEDDIHKEDYTSAHVVAAEQSPDITLTAGPSAVLNTIAGTPDVCMTAKAADEDTEHTVSQGPQQTSPQLKLEACSQPSNTVAPVEVASTGNDVSDSNGWTELSAQQKEEKVDPGKPTPTGQHMNGKVFPRQLDGNFSSLTQINASSYVNKYTNGDIVFTAAAYLAAMVGNSDDAPDDKGGSQKKVKSLSAAEQLKAFSQACPTFFWPSLRKRAMDAPKEKCGWCINCRTPNRKGCLLTQVTGQISGGAAGVTGGIKPVKGAGGHYAAVAAYMLYIEEQLQGLLAGNWEMAGYRKLWRKRVEQGRSIEDVRRALLEMESSLGSVALTSDWEKIIEDAPPLVADYVISVAGPGVASSKKVAPKRRGRPPVLSKNPPAFAYDGACFGVNWWRGGQLSRQVYNWESLPRKTLRRAARQGGLKEIRDLICTKSSDLPRRTLQCAWRARTEKVSAVAQLALQVRCLDRCIRWSEMKSPLDASSYHSVKAADDNKMAKAEILSKSEEEGVVKYLLYFPKDVAETNDSTHQQNDLSTKTMISSNGNCAGKKVVSAGTEGGGNEQWCQDKEVPLWLLKDFEQKRRKTEQMKLHKSIRGRKGQTSAVQKEPSFWDKITEPERYRAEEWPSSWICGFCHSSCTKSQSLQCLRCTENFHISCTEVEETIDGRDKVAVCKNCAKLRLGQRNRKPSYKIRSMQSHYAGDSFVGPSKGTQVVDGGEVAARCGPTPKSATKKKGKASSIESQSSPEEEFSRSDKRKSGNRKNGLFVESELEENVLEKESQTRQAMRSSHLQTDGPLKAGRSKSGRKLKSLQAVEESGISPDTAHVERRTSSRIKANMSPSKSPLPVGQNQSLKVKLKLGKKQASQTSPVSVKEDENRLSSKRKMTLRKDSAPAEAHTSEDDLEFAHVEKKKSPQKRKRLKVLLQGLPITGEDTENSHVPLKKDKKKASNGLQYVRRKTKSDADVARFREEKLVFAGQVGIDPTTGPRCALCSESYDPGFSFISCEWCEEWFHGDAVGLTRENASILMGFKCHKCRKCRAPSCPVSGTRQRRSAAKVRKRGGVDHGEVIDADNVNRSVQPSWKYPLEKDLIGFNDTKDFVAATNQAEQALAVDGSNFGHGLTGSVFELGNGLMSDLEQQLQLTTPLSSLGEHNVNLWANNSGSGQLDLPSGFSPTLDLAGRGSASLSFTELLASEDDYLEGVAGPGLPLGAAWVGDPAVSGSGVASSAAWRGGQGMGQEEAGADGFDGNSVMAGTSGVGPSAGRPCGETNTPVTGVGPCVAWTGSERLSVPDRVGTVAGWAVSEGSAPIGASWVARIDDLSSMAIPSRPTTTDGSDASTIGGLRSASQSGGPQAPVGLDEGLGGEDKRM